jgi:CheY-like chemotaxis protein
MSSVSQSERAQLVYDPMPYGSVLVVDDVETNLYVAKGLMNPYELSIETVGSGFDAVDRVKAGKVYDIVFMDHMMPKMDGIETTKNLRNLGYTHPVIALTANALTGHAEMFMNNGFDGFISKPIDVRQLNVLLNKLVRDKQPYEVIEAARRQKAERQAGGKPAGPPVLKISDNFALDIERALATLEIISKNEFRRNSDVDVFVITVRTTESTLKKMGETELAALALKLEEAGRNRHTDVLTAETPAFLKALRDVGDKVKSKEDGGQGVTEDRVFLHEKLLAVQGACAIKDKKTAKDALVELKRKPWSLPTKELLNTLIGHVLQEKFEEASTLAREFDEMYQDVGEEQDQPETQDQAGP